MKISDAERYGMRVMFYLAVASRDDNTPKTLNEISSEKQISKNYIALIMPKLCKAGLVKSVRGKYGGYLLNRLPEEITYAQILGAFEPKLGLFECVENPSVCKHYSGCPRRDFWEIMNSGIYEHLSKYTLKDAIMHYFGQKSEYMPCCDIDNTRSKKAYEGSSDIGCSRCG